MRLSVLFPRSLRGTPAETDVVGHQLLLRAGYVRQLSAGIFSALPLGTRALHRIEAIVREEMDAIGGQEVLLPVVQPAEIWQQSGRWQSVGEEMVRFQDRAGRDMVLAMTHEEVVTDLARREITSYRQLPLCLYQIQTKFRDEPRPRAGLIRTREFAMKDSYTLDVDLLGLQAQYARHFTAYHRIFTRCGLTDLLAVDADPGMMGGTVTHEFMYLSPIGEDILVVCERCDVAANRQVARFAKPTPAAEEPAPLAMVATPGAATIASLTRTLRIGPERTAKVVLFAAALGAPAEPAPAEGAPRAGARTSPEVLVMALVRGDMEVEETKLSNLIGARWLRPAELERIRAAGVEPGYASPVGLRREGMVVAVDDLVAASHNLVAGANQEGFHLRNVNLGRDFEADVVGDIAAAAEGAACPRCGAPLHLRRGVEVGNTFQLGTHFSQPMGATYSDAEGALHPIVMGCYGIGMGRILACVAEAHRDDRGLRLPLAVAPFPVHLVRLGGAHAEVGATADALAAALEADGIEVLDDDRDVAPGVKFADADLLGMPLRVTVSPRSLAAGGVELRRRDGEATEVVAAGEAAATVRDRLAALREEGRTVVQSPEYPVGGPG
ncbi:MAG TPA: proline--tRNA ligase [Candidatus Micrarchaeia archaeon]|nr:proline--tRNA ligase [Candidatus Micrarchaeia archaeon]